MSMKGPQPTEIDDTEVEQLMDKAQQGRLTAQEQKRLIPLLKTLLWLQQSLLTTRISLSKLKRLLFGKRTEKASAHRKVRTQTTMTARAIRIASRRPGRVPGHHRRIRAWLRPHPPRPIHRRMSRDPTVGMVAGRPPTIAAPNGLFVPYLSTSRARLVRGAKGDACMLFAPWSACVLPVNPWPRSPAMNSVSCAAMAAAPSGWPRCRPRPRQKPMTLASK